MAARFLHHAPGPFPPVCAHSEAHPIHSPPSPVVWALGMQDRQEPDAAAQYGLPWLGLGGKFHWLLVGSTLHTATAQHPRAPSSRPCSSLTRTAPSQPSSPIPAGSVGKTSLCRQSPREVLHSALPGLSSKRFLQWGKLWRWHRGSLPGLPAGPPGTQAGEKDLRASQIKAVGPRTWTCAQRHRTCHLATGWLPAVSASKKGIKPSVCRAHGGRMWTSPTQQCYSNVKVNFPSQRPWCGHLCQWRAASLTQTFPASESQGWDRQEWEVTMVEAGPPSRKSTGPAGLALWPRHLSWLEEVGKMSSLRQRGPGAYGPRETRKNETGIVLKGETGLLPPWFKRLRGLSLPVNMQ